MTENMSSVKVLKTNGFKYLTHINEYHDLDEYSDKGGDIYKLDL